VSCGVIYDHLSVQSIDTRHKAQYGASRATMRPDLDLKGEP
jgi:hypothetical protein